MRPKVFSILEEKSPKYFEDLYMCHNGRSVRGDLLKDDIRQFLEYAYENRDKGIQIESMYEKKAQSFPPHGKWILSDIFLDILKGEDRFTFWRIYMSAAQWHNMKHQNDPGFEVIDIVSMYRELGLLNDEVIVYAGELNKQLADEIINNPSLSDEQRVSMLKVLQRKSESTYGGLVTPLRYDFEDYVRTWIRKIEGDNRTTLISKEAPDNPNRKIKHHTTQEVVVLSSVEKIKKKRLDTRMDNAASRYGKLFAELASYLVRQEVLSRNGDNFIIRDGSTMLFSYIGMRVHEATQNPNEDKKSYPYWAYFRERLSCPDLSKDTINNELRKIKSGHRPSRALTVDSGLKLLVKRL